MTNVSRHLTTWSLCQVELTWDETSKDRIAVTMRRFNKDELDEMDLNDYLASDDDDAPGDASLSNVMMLYLVFSLQFMHACVHI